MLKKYKILISALLCMCALLITSSASAAIWTAQTASPVVSWRKVASSGDGEKLAAVSTSYVYLSSDSGVTWATTTTSEPGGSRLISSSSDGVYLITGNGSYLKYSTTSGSTWATSTFYGTNIYGGDSSADGSKVTVAVRGGYVYISTDYGATFATSTDLGNSSTNGWRDSSISNDGTKLTAVSDYGYIHYSTTSGATWATSTSPLLYWHHIADSEDGSKLIAIDTDANGIYTSSDSGATWTSRGLSGYYFEGVASSADGTILIAAEYGGYMHVSLDSGVTWTQQTSAGSRNWYGVAMSSDGTKLVALNSGGYVYTGLIDLTGPVISSLGATPSATGATITWTTNESATSSVSYGITGSYGFASTSATSSTSHSLTLTGLQACTYYLYQASSTDVSANVSTTTGNFSTTGCAEVQSGGSSNSGGGGSSSNDEDEDEDNDSDEDEADSDDADEDEEDTKFEQLQKVIDSLVAQIKALMEARGLSFTAPSVAAGANANENASFNRDLEMGSVGDDVKVLQMFLNKNGFIVALSGDGSLGNETTTFGSATKAALMKFQQANGITPASGYFGPKTRAVMK